MTCKECVHYVPCYEYGNILDPIHGGVKCDSFKSAADVVEVVRCKDCKHYCLSDYRKPNEPRWCEFYEDGYYYPNPNDYCSNGERRDENER